MDTKVDGVYQSYPIEASKKLLEVRALLFAVASETPDVGTITEALK